MLRSISAVVCLAALSSGATTFPSKHYKRSGTNSSSTVSSANKHLSRNQYKQIAKLPKSLVKSNTATNASLRTSKLAKTQLATTCVNENKSAKGSCEKMKPINLSPGSIGMPKFSKAQSKRLTTDLTNWQPYSIVASVVQLFWHAMTLLPLIMFASLVESSPLIRARMYAVANMIASWSIATKVLLTATMVFFSECDTVQASWNLLKVSDEPGEYAQFKTLTSAQGLALFVLLLSPFDINNSATEVSQVTATAISIIRILALQFATSLLLFPILMAIKQFTGSRYSK